MKARDEMRVLMLGDAPKFKRECEDKFSDFRLRVVHLRNDREELDSLEDKEIAWKFICRFSKECPFHKDRCTEVLRILLLSDAWMQAFARDPDVDVESLPPDIKKDFEKRLQEVEKDQPPSRPQPKKTNPWSEEQSGYPQQPKAGPRTDPWSPKPKTPAPGSLGGMPQMMPNSMSVVVQRCLQATLASDDTGSSKQNIGPGLVVSVCMADGATQEGVTSAAKFILTAKLSGKSRWFPGSRGLDQFGSGAESVASLCKGGVPQGILIVPQPSLVADIEDGKDTIRNVAYTRFSKTSQMYDLFVESMRSSAPELVEQATATAVETGGLGGFVSGLVRREQPKVLPEIISAPFGNNAIFMDMRSAGPFMHSFNF
jgi:D-Tyr-tRNAtyr deacylase